MQIHFTVLFESPFWVAVAERQQGQELTVARVVFGAEPTSAEVYEFVLRQWRQLPFGQAHSAQEHPQAPRSPKRLLREARRFQVEPHLTKAQAALQADLETRKEQAKSRRREQRDEEQERRYQQRRQKAKAKYRGH